MAQPMMLSAGREQRDPIGVSGVFMPSVQRLLGNRLSRRVLGHRLTRQLAYEARSRLARGARPPRPAVPIVINAHHKTGSTLMHAVFRKICAEFDWRLAWVYQAAPAELPPHTDVVVVAHSHINLGRVRGDYVGAHIVRDPRDVIVSGYEYHQTTDELWCINEDLDPTPPITLPRVPYWIEPRPEAWKRDYLASLGGRSYQANLRALPQEEGVAFEMAGYSSWTIGQMRGWNYEDERIVELKFEEVLADFDQQMRRMFVALGFAGEWLERAVEIAATEDLGRMDAERLTRDPHIRSRGVSRWEPYFSTDLRRAFKERFGDVVVQLGYEESNDC